MESVAIILNGTMLKVKHIEFKKATEIDEEFFHDCYITFMSGEIERYDAQDVIVLKDGEYNEEELIQ